MGNLKRHYSNPEKKICREKLLTYMFGQSGKIPWNAEGRYERVPVYWHNGSQHPWGHMTVVIRPFVPSVKMTTYGHVKKSSAHRVMVICERCECEVPFGRYHQHYGSGSCKESYKLQCPSVGFIQAIDEGDRTALLVYADWLTERDDKDKLAWGLREIVRRDRRPIGGGDWTWITSDTQDNFPYLISTDVHGLLTGVKRGGESSRRFADYLKKSDAYFDLAQALYELHLRELLAKYGFVKHESLIQPDKGDCMQWKKPDDGVPSDNNIWISRMRDENIPIRVTRFTYGPLLMAEQKDWEFKYMVDAIEFANTLSGETDTDG